MSGQSVQVTGGTVAADAAMAGQEPRSAASEPVFSRRNLNTAFTLWLCTLLILVACQVAFGRPYMAQSRFPYFVNQAWSWLHGSWSIDPPLGTRTDLALLHGKWYEIYPQFPSVLMLPFVAIFGPGMSDNFFTDVVSACDLGLLFLLFEQMRATGLVTRSHRENVMWSVLLFFGSIVFSMTIIGEVWRTAHIVVIGCVLLSLLLAFRRHYVWSALLLACAFLTRNTLALGFPFLLFLAWYDGQGDSVKRFVSSLKVRRPAWSEVPWARLGSILAVAFAAVALFMVRNQNMFGSPLETGYDIVNAQRYPFIHDGLFNIKYVPANLLNDFFNFPRITFPNPYLYHATIDMMNGGTGMCVFLTSPLFLLLFWQNRQRSLLRAALWATIGLLTAFVLLFYTAGYYNLGSRYLSDAYPYVWALLALMDIRFSWRIVALGLIGVVVNLLGAHQYGNSQLLGF